MRAFAGIELPAILGTKFLKHVRTVRAGAELSIMRPEKIHLTLAFFADLEPADVPKVEAAIRSAFSKAFEISITQLSMITRRGVPSVIFVEAQSDVLTAAVEAFKDNLRAQGVPFDNQPFKPHLTLARIKKLHDETILQKDLAESKRRFVVTPFSAEKITLYSSNLVTYKRVLEVPLELPEPEPEVESELEEKGAAE